MKRKILIPFLLAYFCFLPFSTSLIWGQSSSISENDTNRQWLQFMEDHAFNTDGLGYKMPILAAELNLNAHEQLEIKNLFSDHGGEKTPGQEAASPGGGGPRDQAPNDAQRKDKNANLDGIGKDADGASAKTLREVKAVRKMLGDHDLDFRFWFFEEGMIDNAEDSAYLKNRHYSADKLIAGLIKTIQQTPEFQDFKARKTARLHSVAKVEDYFSNWQSLLANRVLVQIKQVKRRNLINN